MAIWHARECTTVRKKASTSPTCTSTPSCTTHCVPQTRLPSNEARPSVDSKILNTHRGNSSTSTRTRNGNQPPRKWHSSSPKRKCTSLLSKTGKNSRLLSWSMGSTTRTCRQCHQLDRSRTSITQHHRFTRSHRRSRFGKKDACAVFTNRLHT